MLAASTLTAAEHPTPPSPQSAEQLAYIHQTYIPKRETGVLEFLKKHPEYDGSGVIMAIIDTGVDPSTADLQTTPDGKPKILDIIDASGSGDVDTSTVVELSAGEPLTGLTGRTLTLPENITNPEGKFFIGRKYADDLFASPVLERLHQLRRDRWEALKHQRRIERTRARDAERATGKRGFEDKAASELTRAEQDILARESILENIEDNFADRDLGLVFDCVVWNDGEHYNVLVDTDGDGDLAEEKILRPYGVDHEYAWFEEEVATNFGVQVYEEGKLLSIVTVTDSHGTHVASIATAYNPEQPERNGIAPGAQIISINIGVARSGASSEGLGETRAVGLLAKYGVDVMNMSFGGGSRYQDGRDLYGEHFRRLVMDYGITALLSAGNSGPGLSTVGSPGAELPEIIGVGAYVSKDMGHYLYSLMQDSPDTNFQFSSTGPTKGGDLGVDIMAPGGAVASIAFNELSGKDLYHGTSMASPSAAGLVALLVSGAKAEGIDYNPFRIRAALMNSARYLEGVTPWTQGAGLIQAEPAWQHLRQYQDLQSLNYHYNINCTGNSILNGPGIYFRSNESFVDNSFRISVTPAFLASVTPQEKVAFQQELQLRCDADWVEVPEFFYLGSAGNSFRPVIRDPAENSTPGDVQFARIDAFPSNNLEAGPLFSIPITRVTGIPLKSGEITTLSAQLKTGDYLRKFVAIPDAHSQINVRIRRTPGDGDLATYVLQTVSLSSYDRDISTRYFVLKPGDDASFTLPVFPGGLTEINLNHMWHSPGSGELTLEVTPVGLVAKSEETALVNGRSTDGISLMPLQASFNGTASATIEQAVLNIPVAKASEVPGDARSFYPDVDGRSTTDQPQFLRVQYDFELEADAEVRVGAALTWDLEDRVSRQMLRLYHEDGRVFYLNYWLGAQLPKGKYSAYSLFYTYDKSALEVLKTAPLVLFAGVQGPTLPVYESSRDIAYQRDAGQITLQAHKNYQLFVSKTDEAPLRELKPSSQNFRGHLRIQGADGSALELPLAYQLGPKPTDEEEDAQIAPADPRSLDTKLSDQLFASMMDFAAQQAELVDDEAVASFDKIVLRLKELKPDHPGLYLLAARATAFRGNLLDSKDSKEAEDNEAPESLMARDQAAASALKLIAKARASIDTQALAAFFGAPDKPDAEDSEALAQWLYQEQKMNEQRAWLQQAAQLECRIQLSMAKPEAARDALKEARRWNADEKTLLPLQLDLLEQEALYGLALQTLEQLLEETPIDASLLQRRLELYRKLDWSYLAENERIRLAILASEKRPSMP